ncbi:DNA polymerase III subunit gamma and tau [Nonomuraea sp. NPDC050556]|uniref:DNA polymerase III subunit gamma and tau n=1 Tax=Nonomuraea sp. NPDC050556 TaxID=3364369 RepID=UPI00378CB560
MSLALYRRYRPGTFAEVKGQDHVTDPLRQALRTGRINHAYLFSGPRGCGKTSSARILARSLNCEKGPTPDPCGECDSCVALAPTGPGHLDVIEIDAASHGGVDDARDLRERAFFAPVSARFKIYIIDEAHMVTREGFNALLKLVEEPPPHLKFIFATTEPEKVIGTIKSRTHHYPFRLMPPATLKALLEEILLAESVPYEQTALPLVVRAGAGSARDSLSILDQLLAGADDDGITYAKAVSLLGYTDGDLLDEVIDAFAGRDGAKVFHAVNRVIEGGHDPRRFAADLLERFRDLVILANVPEAASSGLLDRPADELDRLVAQAASMGPAELTRAAEVFNAGLTEMRGATSPRLLLELMCARVLLPGAAQGEEALLARLERLERGGVVANLARQSQPPSVSSSAAPSGGTAGADHGAAGPSSAVHGTAGSASADVAEAHGPGPANASPSTAGGEDWPEAARPGAPAQAPQEVAQQPVSSAPSGGGGAVQQQWPAILAALKSRSIVVWANVNTNAQVVGVEGNLVTLGFSQVGAMKNFTGGGKDAVVATALSDVLGGNWRVEAVVGGSPLPTSRAPQGSPTRPGSGQNAPSGGHGAPGSGTDGPGQSGPGAQGQPGAGASGDHGSGGTAGPQGASAQAGQQGGAPSGDSWAVGSEASGSGGSATGAGGQGAAGGGQGAQGAGAQAQGGQGAGSGGSAAQGAGAQGAGGPAAQGAGVSGAGQVVQGAGGLTARGGSAGGGPQTTDESWPDAPDDPVSADGPSSSAPVSTGAGLAAARSAARAAAQAGPRAPAPRQGGAAGWPDAVPGRTKGPESDEVDPLNDADADVDAVGGMALLQRELGAQVIGEIDHT